MNVPSWFPAVDLICLSCFVACFSKSRMQAILGTELCLKAEFRMCFILPLLAAANETALGIYPIPLPVMRKSIPRTPLLTIIGAYARYMTNVHVVCNRKFYYLQRGHWSSGEDFQ